MQPEKGPDRPKDMFRGEQPLTEEQRTEAVKTLLGQGFSVGDIWLLAPFLLSVEPGSAEAVAIPTVPF